MIDKGCDTCKWCCNSSQHGFCVRNGLVNWKPKPKMENEMAHLIEAIDGPTNATSTISDAESQTLYQALKDLWDEYTIQREQFGDNPIWIKYEDMNVIEPVARILQEREK